MPDAATPAHLTKFYESTVQDGPVGPGECIVVLTTDRCDRDGEVVLASGGILDNYRRNPVVMYGHAKGTPEEGEAGLPVGKNVWIKPTRDGHGLVGKHVYDLDDSFSARVCGKAKRGYLNTHSITFLPIEYGPPTREEIARRPDWAKAKRVYRKWELVEYSVVAMPANVDAETLAKRGKTMGDEQAKGAADPVSEVPGDGQGGAVAPQDAVPDVPPDAEDAAAGAAPDADEVAKAFDPDDDGDDDSDGHDEPEDEPVKRGDHVRCKAPHCKGHGMVVSVHKDGMVPDVDEDIHGSKSAPACRVKMYKAVSGGHVPTAIHKGMMVAHVEKLDKPLSPPKKAKSALAVAPEPVRWTPTEKAAYLNARLTSPDLLTRVMGAVQERIDVRLLGKV
jgi:hypothetical protein